MSVQEASAIAIPENGTSAASKSPSQVWAAASAASFWILSTFRSLVCRVDLSIRRLQGRPLWKKSVRSMDGIVQRLRCLQSTFRARTVWWPASISL